MKSKLFLVFLFFILVKESMAGNGCPDGMTPFQNGGDPTPKCYPIQDSQNITSVQPRGHWETRWGAVAIGFSKADAGIGFSKDISSKRKAEKEAVTQCKAVSGSAKCKITLRYYNQCAVFAWGDTANVTESAGTIEIASQLAMQKCDRKTTSCKIAYADCSPPVWIK
jgi:Domain of unknown function (DUF4189)